MQKNWRMEEDRRGRNIRYKGMCRTMRRVRIIWQRLTEGFVVVAEK